MAALAETQGISCEMVNPVAYRLNAVHGRMLPRMVLWYMRAKHPQW